jgi:NAD(P)-dependent dehydrogenase (short-subunit alcohol dehydrogenase family)
MNKLDFNLDGKVALITGPGRGIGKTIASLYAEKGANLILLGRSDNILQTEKTVLKTGVKTLPLIYDITKQENIEEIISKSIDKFGRIDILVNNAGTVLPEKAEDLSKSNWDQTILVNLTAPFLLSQAVGREMIKRKYGKIINIASMAGVLGFEKRSAYCASKSGLIGLTRALSVEWAKYKINVNSISPTVTLTEMGKKAWAGQAGIEMKKKIPLGRFLDPEDIATAAVFLGSDASNMITGANLVIDGGFSIK